LAALLVPGPAQALGATFTVTSTADFAGSCIPASMNCTLREAMTSANALPGPDTIDFDIIGTPRFTIQYTSPLPTATDPLTIDGTTQPGYAGSPVVKLEAIPGAVSPAGLTMTVGGNALYGLEISAEALGLSMSGLNDTMGAPGKGNIISASGLGATAVRIGNATTGGIGNVVQANRISSRDFGLVLNGSDTTIGGTGSGTGNDILGAMSFGLSVTGDRNLVAGNSIAGRGALRISGSDNTVGGTAGGANTIRVGSVAGASISGDRNQIQGNSIEVNHLGAPGVDVSGTGNHVLSNTILDAVVGVSIRTGAGNEILSNIIPLGIGIRLGNGAGPNDPGDADTGPNNLQNHPVLSYAQSAPSGTTIAGTLNSEPNKTYRLEFFSSTFRDIFTPCDGSLTSSGRGGAETVLGSDTVTTGGSGDASFRITVPTSIPSGDWVTATATDPEGNTSEFALCRQEGLADLSVTKNDSPDPVAVGQALTYDLAVRNGGPSTIDQVILTDELPSGVTVMSASPSAGFCEGPYEGRVRCSLGSLGGGEVATIQIRVTPQAEGTLTNRAVVAPAEPYASRGPADPDMSNNTAEAQTTVVPLPNLADLSVTKSDSPDPVFANEPLIYTVTVGNNGPASATGVTLTDDLPKHARIRSVTPTQGTCAARQRTIRCSLGDLSNGGSATVTIEVTPRGSRTLTNTASVSAGSPPDPDTSNTTATASTQVLR
jgi:uncharacterized repeat protein (TIGR01451 family)/CSLREA domain-containing protein